MGKITAKSDYENLRNARILENQARLASLGVQKTVSDLRSFFSSAKPRKTQIRKWQKKEYEITPVRRSNRFKGITPSSAPANISLRRSNRLNGKVLEYEELEKVKEKSPAYTSSVTIHRQGRGHVYNPVYGICCHFCRQKTLCAEEDCKRCGNFDLDQPCIGKTDCSVCHSSYGVLCRACLMVRYGEELEEVRENKEWMCPHCIEEKGIKPYWICNRYVTHHHHHHHHIPCLRDWECYSSICLKNRKMAPTGIAIYRARELGYKSVAHLLMDELQRSDSSRLICSK